jgi:hypothetical protein
MDIIDVDGVFGLRCELIDHIYWRSARVGLTEYKEEEHQGEERKDEPV